MILNRAEAVFIHYATLINGGYTYADQQRTPRTGYLVSRGERTQVLLPEEFTPEALQRFSAVHEGALGRPGVWLGTWVNGTTNIHIDVVEWYADRGTARDRAWAQGQESFYDLGERQVIKV